MVSEVELHLLEVDTFEMASGHDTGGQREGGAILEEIEEIVLTSEDDGEIRFRVSVELAQGVEFFEGFEPEEAGLVDDEQGLEFLTDEFDNALADDAEEGGTGGTLGV